MKQTLKSLPKKVDTYLFGNWDRIFTSISILFSIFSVAITVVVTYFTYTDDDPTVLMIVRDLGVIFGLIIIGLILLTKYVRQEFRLRKLIAQADTANKFLSNQFKNSYDLVRRFRNKSFNHYLKFITEESLVTRQITETQWNFFHKLCRSLTSDVKKSFVEYFNSKGIEIGNDIAITVKLLIPSSEVISIIETQETSFTEEDLVKVRKEKEWVITAFRDHYTYEHNESREVRGAIYSIRDNTAFAHVILNEKPHFFCNDLRNYENYSNKTESWENYYNSTLVVPIRYYDRSNKKNRCFGVLSVDSLNEKGEDLYNTKECKWILSHVADLLTNHFLGIALYQFSNENE